MPTLSELLKKAHGALNSFRVKYRTTALAFAEYIYFFLLDIAFCIKKTDTDDPIKHIPEYLTLQCQSDYVLRITLILQRLLNKTLEKNPKSIRNVSQRNQNVDDINYERVKFRNINKQNNSGDDENDDGNNSNDDTNGIDDYDDDDDDDKTQADHTTEDRSPVSENDINVEMNGNMITVISVKRRPNLFMLPDIDSSSATTSGADEFSDKDEELIHRSSSSDDLEFQDIDHRNESFAKNSSVSPILDWQFLVCQLKPSKTELDPEEDLYERVSWNFWKSYKNQDGSIDDSFTMRKVAIYFAAVNPTLRKEAWPFLLRVYPWTSTHEQREIIWNDIFIEHQKIKKRKMNNALKSSWIDIENAIINDVIRMDRCKSYFAGDNNPNIDIMKNILLNYATACPETSYVQGMSDLLAPLLRTIHDESDTY